MRLRNLFIPSETLKPYRDFMTEIVTRVCRHRAEQIEMAIRAHAGHLHEVSVEVALSERSTWVRCQACLTSTKIADS